MPIYCISPIFDNDVGMRLKDGDNLFLSSDFFSHKDTPPGLAYHFFGKPGIMLDLRIVGRTSHFAQSITEHPFSDFKQIDLCSGSLLLIFGVHDSQHAAFCPSGMIAKPRHPTELVPYALNEPGQNSYGIPQKTRVSRRVDMAFDAGAVRTYRSAFFNALVFGIAQDVTIDQPPGTSADSLVLLSADLIAVIGLTDGRVCPHGIERAYAAIGQALTASPEAAYGLACKHGRRVADRFQHR